MEAWELRTLGFRLWLYVSGGYGFRKRIHSDLGKGYKFLEMTRPIQYFRG
jgi:hypothetical protein